MGEDLLSMNRKIMAEKTEARNLLSTIVDRTAVLIWTTGIDGKCQFFNRAWLDFTGSNLELQLSEGILSRIHLEERQKFTEAFSYALQHRVGFELEYRLLRFDGQYCWILNNVVPWNNEEGDFAGLIGSCIDISQRKQIEQDLTEKLEKNRILSDIIQNIHRSIQLTAILPTAIEQTNRLLKVETIFIAKIIAGNSLHILCESHFPELALTCRLRALPLESLIHLFGKLEHLEAGNTIIIENADLRCLSKYNSHFNFHGYTNLSAIAVPLIVDAELWGLLWLQQSSTPRLWQVAEIDFMEQIALHLSLAIQKAELYQRLERNNLELESLATVDSLTKIANRRKFDEYIASEWRRLSREQTSLSLILCDIDHFKLYNDTYGHQAGDYCLHLVAKAITKAIKRPADLVARYGGEEFAVILPHTNLEGAEYLAQQIRWQIQALEIPHINSPTDLYITLSLGVSSCIPNHLNDPSSLIFAADSALYRAKQLGRNRVIKCN
jgi:diguanylate cyclase (GGDEF)-like protein/PAS domain S-box-containing protein